MNDNLHIIDIDADFEINEVQLDLDFDEIIIINSKSNDKIEEGEKNNANS